MPPLKTEFITVKKSKWIKNRLLISIDSGNSLTKLLFLNKMHYYLLKNKEEASILLNFILFKNSDFDCALELVKNSAYFPENNNFNLYVTGVFALKNLEKIKFNLGINTIFIDEFLTIAESHRFLVEHIGVDNLLANKFMESNIDKINNQSSSIMPDLYPKLFHIHGSSSGCFYFSNDITEYWSILHQGGKTFLGLAKCILNTNDYDEIVSLATQGNKCNVDTQVKEMFDQTIDSTYELPSEMSMFSYGKCMDLNKGLRDFSKHDLAASLISYHAKFIIMFAASICSIKKVSKIYLTGNIFNSEIFQKEIVQFESNFPFAVKPIILNFGYFGALGAMLHDENTTKIPLKNF